ncbi:MAG: hypothetical protein P8M73_11950 [Luminiphilus sp.]|nr:hypothetical protein [Luminiphilus sp.]
MTKALLIALLVLPMLLQAEGRDIAYAKINTALSVETQSPLLEVKLSVDIADATLSFEEVKVWLVQDDEVVSEMFVDPVDGSIQLPTLTEKQARRHLLRINQSEELVQISFDITVLPPLSTEIRYRELFYVVDDANLFIKAMAGPMAFLAPKVARLKFHFTESATITVRGAGEPLSFETDSHLSISIKQSSDLMEMNPMVVFSAIPVAIEPVKWNASEHPR